MADRFKFDLGNAVKVQDFVGKKATPTIYFQNPPAHTPLTEGMVVEVKTVSSSDVPIGVVAAEVPEAVKGVPVDAFNLIFTEDPELVALGASPVLADEQKSIFAEKINAGLSKQGFGAAVTPENAAGLSVGLQKAGFFK